MLFFRWTFYHVSSHFVNVVRLVVQKLNKVTHAFFTCAYVTCVSYLKISSGSCISETMHRKLQVGAAKGHMGNIPKPLHINFN